MVTQSINLKGALDLPSISFQPDGNLSLVGCSIPLNAYSVYKQLIEFVEFLTAGEVSLVVDLEYLNGATVKSLFDILKAIENNPNITHANILWWYDANDIDSIATGKTLNSIAQKCNFVFQAKLPLN